MPCALSRRLAAGGSSGSAGQWRLAEHQGLSGFSAMPDARRRFFRNAVTSYGQTGLLGLSALLLTPYLFRTLGTGGFGTWSVMFTLTAVFSVVEVGFAAGPTKFIAEHRAKEDRGRLESTLGASVTIMGALGLLALA